jgi:hypothetical protein
LFVAVAGIAACNSILGVDHDYTLGDAETSSGSATAGSGGSSSSGTAANGGGTAANGGGTAASGGNASGGGGTGSGGSGGTGGAATSTNVVLAANGAVIDSFTSEYCHSPNPPGDCQAGFWNHTNIHDGEHATGNDATAFRASWASDEKAGMTTPEEFIFSFAGGMSARINSLVIQNYGDEPGGPYYSSHVIVYAEPPGGGAWVEILDADLVAAEQPQVFDLVALNGSAAEAGRLRLSITAGVNGTYWDLGEFEAWGELF